MIYFFFAFRGHRESNELSHLKHYITKPPVFVIDSVCVTSESGSSGVIDVPPPLLLLPFPPPTIHKHPSSPLRLMWNLHPYFLLSWEILRPNSCVCVEGESRGLIPRLQRASIGLLAALRAWDPEPECEPSQPGYRWKAETRHGIGDILQNA